jgi:hypothetical protein
VLGEQPLELRRREVRIGHETGAVADQLRVERRAAIRRAPVLPHDRAVDGPAGATIPEDRGLALVRNRDRVELGRRDACILERRGRGNPLFLDPKTMMLFGDAKESVARIAAAVKAL